MNVKTLLPTCVLLLSGGANARNLRVGGTRELSSAADMIDNLGTLSSPEEIDLAKQLTGEVLSSPEGSQYANMLVSSATGCGMDLGAFAAGEMIDDEVMECIQGAAMMALLMSGNGGGLPFAGEGIEEEMSMSMPVSDEGNARTRKLSSAADMIDNLGTLSSPEEIDLAKQLTGEVLSSPEGSQYANMLVSSATGCGMDIGAFAAGEMIDDEVMECIQGAAMMALLMSGNGGGLPFAAEGIEEEMSMSMP